MKVFELHNSLVGDTVSFHTTIEGAVLAMSEEIRKLAPVMQKDWGDDVKIEFTLSFSVISHEVKE